MLLTAHQPNYLPYGGFFQKIAAADEFLVVDTTQFVKRGPFGWIHRNKIRTPNVPIWLTLPVLDWLDLSARFVYAYWGNIEGADSSLNPNAVPTADPDLRKGQRIDLLAGLSVKLPWDRFGEHRFGVEAGGPPWQKLDGPQLGSKWRVTAGWQLTF